MTETLAPPEKVQSPPEHLRSKLKLPLSEMRKADAPQPHQSTSPRSSARSSSATRGGYQLRGLRASTTGAGSPHTPQSGPVGHKVPVSARSSYSAGEGSLSSRRSVDSRPWSYSHGADRPGTERTPASRRLATPSPASHRTASTRAGGPTPRREHSTPRGGLVPERVYNELSAQLKETAGELRHYTEQYDAQAAKLESQATEIGRLGEQLAEARRCVEEQQLQLGALQAELSCKGQEADEWQSKATALQSEGANLRSTIELSSTTRDVTNRVLLDMSERAMHVEAERLRLEELMEQLVLEMETVMRQRDEEVASMRQSHVTQAQQIQEACGQEVACKLRALEAMLELRNSELARSRQHEAALADKVKQMEHKIANGELPSLGSSIFTFDDDSTELLCDSSSVEEQLEAALQGGQDGLETHRATNRRELIAKLQEQLKAKEQCIEVLKSREQGWMEQLRGMSERRTQLEIDLAKSLRDRKEGRGELEALRAEKAALEQRVAESTAQSAPALAAEPQPPRTSDVSPVAPTRARKRVLGAIALPATMLVGGVLGAVLGRGGRQGARPIVPAPPSGAAPLMARAGEVTWRQPGMAS
eukprot:jgi/Tetstr1/457997/TSEL_044508.t1